MAASTVEHAPLPALRESELVITLSEGTHAQYVGTAAQLVREGLLPADFEWPGGTSWKFWEACGLDYSLRRVRRPGHKGAWRDLDRWCLTSSTKHTIDSLELARSERQLREAAHRYSPTGQRETRVRLGRYRRAREDETFQAFKAIFVPKKFAGPNFGQRR